MSDDEVLAELRTLHTWMQNKGRWYLDGRVILDHKGAIIGIMDHTGDAALVVAMATHIDALIDIAWAARQAASETEVASPGLPAIRNLRSVLERLQHPVSIAP